MDMNMDLTIRRAVEADFKRVNELFHEMAAFQGVPHKVVNTVEKMKAQQDSFECYVAETPDKAIVGYTVLFACYFTWTGKSLYMDDLYVVEQFRGKGVGNLLIERAITRAREMGCYKLHWQVGGWNEAAKSFYTKLGAEIDGTEMNCDLIL